MNLLRIVILGGGFAGVQAARAVRRSRPDARIAVIDRTGLATMIPALPDLLSGRFDTDRLTRPLVELLGDGFDVVTDEVVAVRPDERVVVTRDRTIAYDGLVIATGSVPTEPPGSLASTGRVFTVHSADAAASLRDALEEHGVRSLVIAGAGYTGLELAIALSESSSELGALHIVVADPAPTVLPMLTGAERERVLAELDARGIDLRTGATVEAARAADADAPTVDVELSDGTRAERALFVWSAGMRATPIEINARLERTRDGRVRTNESLQLVGHPEVFVAGDAAALSRDGVVVRRAVNFAYYSGRVAGKNVAAHLSGKPLRAFRPFDLGWIIPLGRASAGRLFGAIPVRGRIALRAHYLMCGIRHFGGGRAGAFLGAALALRRRYAPLARRAPTGISR